MKTGARTHTTAVLLSSVLVEFGQVLEGEELDLPSGLHPHYPIALIHTQEGPNRVLVSTRQHLHLQGRSVCVCVCVCVCDVTKMANTSKSESRSHLSD